MNKSLIAAAIGCALLVPAINVFAADEPASPWTVTTNIYAVSDNYFRGLTQTWHKPAIQGGVDFVHADGWYAGLWGSNVSSNQFPGGGVEFDYYGGYNGKFNDDFSWTAGGHAYDYPGANFNQSNPVGAGQSFNSFEVNAGLSWKFLGVKYSRFVTDWFGVNKKTGYPDDSTGTDYLEFNLAYEFEPSYTLNVHAGRTTVATTTTAHNSLDYTDYLLGLTRTFTGGWVASLAWTKAIYDDTAWYKPTVSFNNPASTITDPGAGKLILSVGRVF